MAAYVAPSEDDVRILDGEMRAVAFKEGDVWVIQGIEYDVVAQTADIFQAPIAFLKILVSTMLINQKLGRGLLSGLKPAPERFRAMYDEATMELNPIGPMPVQSSFPRPNVAMRGYSKQAA